MTVNTDAPNNDINHLVNNVLLSSGVQASNFSFEGHPKQIGYFDGSNSNIGLSGSIVLSTGDVSVLAPSFSGTPILVTQMPAITDPDLLNVANSVPGMIGQSFSVSEINDVAVIEFDFVSSSDTVSFNYVFGSQEYFGFENSSFNDVFGFFVSGPGITGPYSSPAAFPDEYDYLWSTNETTQSINVGPGTYWFTASNDGCDVLSDTITVEEKSLGVSLGEDLSVCSGDSTTMNIKYLTGEAPYFYQWSTGQTTTEINAPVGNYSVTVTDVNNCKGSDTIEIH
jgi:hypothetical protein